jgi:hypothetical protein
VVKGTGFSTQGQGICQNVRIGILYDGGVIALPLSKKGCSGKLSIMTVDDKMIDGKINDLSGFGVSFDHFVNVMCSSKNGLLSFFGDEKKFLI